MDWSGKCLSMCLAGGVDNIRFLRFYNGLNLANKKGHEVSPVFGRIDLRGLFYCYSKLVFRLGNCIRLCGSVYIKTLIVSLSNFAYRLLPLFEELYNLTDP
jgi:hypothetical protein